MSTKSRKTQHFTHKSIEIQSNLLLLFFFLLNMYVINVETSIYLIRHMWWITLGFPIYPVTFNTHMNNNKMCGCVWMYGRKKISITSMKNGWFWWGVRIEKLCYFFQFFYLSLKIKKNEQNCHGQTTNTNSNDYFQFFSTTKKNMINQAKSSNRCPFWRLLSFSMLKQN